VFAEWALYNQVMFASRNRRRREEPVTPEEVAVFFDLTPEQVTACQRARRNVMQHDDAGHLRSCHAFAKVPAKKLAGAG
jgi:poly-beta-1,6-N-acetyl-D-glucosamine biosynthesis protein PgaD